MRALKIKKTAESAERSNEAMQ